MENKESERLVEQVVKNFRSDRKWTVLKRVGLTALFLLAFVTGLWGFVQKVGRLPTFGPNIAVVTIKGEILDGAAASANRVIPSLRNAFQDDDAKMVILEIDSPGGSPFESERINTELALLKKKHPKPVIAVINSVGASAAYLIAINADKVIAGRYSLVGSIGVIASAWDIHGLAQRFDIKQQSFASGPLKDMFNPLQPRSAAEVAKAQAMVNSFAQVFISEVKLKRAKKLTTQDFTSGEAWTGDEALAMGLIDQIGTIDAIAADQNLELSYLGPAGHPGFFASFEGGIAKGVENGIRAWAQQGIQIR